jgi:hypothetical protein
MAGGKLTPRQKMINPCIWFYRYVGNECIKEVITGFGLMNEKFET